MYADCIYFKLYLRLFFVNRHLKHFTGFAGDNSSWWKAGIGVAAATVMGLVLIKIFNFQKR